MKIKTILFLSLLFILSPIQAQNHVLSFDGQNDYVNLGSNAGDEIRSIELWFKTDIEIFSTNMYRYTMVTRNSGDQNGEFGIFIGYNFAGEQGRVTFTRQVGYTFHYVYSDQNHWEANRWYHVAGVIDPVDGMKLYIDGVIQQDSDATTLPTEVEDEITTIGCWGNNYNRCFNGEIDEVRFWKRALTQEEIQEHMCESIDPSLSNDLWAYYDMNEGSGNTILNYGEEGTDGIMMGSIFELGTPCQPASTPDPLWLKAIQGTHDEEGLDVCVDSDGAIITCGYFYSNMLYAGNMSLEKQSGCDAYVIKYNMNGDPIWLDNPGGATLQEAHGIRADQDNNIYVTGLFKGDFQFAGTILQSGNEANAFLIKYDAEGNEIWAVEMNTYDVAEGREIAIDEDGNIILGIRFRGSLTIGNITLSNHGSLDLAIIKFNPQGEVIWARSYGGSYRDFIMNLCTDDQNHVYFTGGAHSGSITFGNFTLVNQSTQRLAFIVHMDESGEVLWAEGHDDGYDQEFIGIAVDSEHNIYTSGYYKEVFNFGPHSIYGDGGHFDVFIAKYNSSHDHQWIKKITTTIYGRSDHLILDHDENPVINISHFGNLIIEGQTIFNQGGEDLTLAKFDAAGGLVWTLHAGGMYDERSFGLASGPFGNLYFSGYYGSQKLDIGPFFIQNIGGKDAYIAALGPPCPLPDPAFTFSANELNVQFTATGVADTYNWDFGDGTTSVEKDPVHTYDTVGNFQVCLNVQNSCGSMQGCQDVSVCADPTSDFSWTANDKYVAFYQASTFAEDYQWNLGDGTHSYEAEPLHEYDDYGIYYVDLIVYNQCGADQHFDTVYILAPLMCNFSFTLDDMGMVQFHDESIEAKNYFWNFGDGTTSTEKNPTHQYETNGIYECCLAIETELGSYTYCAQITVENIPEEETTTFKLYVDPVGQSLVIDIPDDGLYKFFIYDTWGKPAYSNEVQLPGNSVYQIGLTNLPAGIYIVIVESALISERTKVMVPSF